jgi:hypothetical protein
MRIIEGILFEPVGCLAEFPSEPFSEIAASRNAVHLRIFLTVAAVYDRRQCWVLISRRYSGFPLK